MQIFFNSLIFVFHLSFLNTFRSKKTREKSGYFYRVVDSSSSSTLHVPNADGQTSVDIRDDYINVDGFVRDQRYDRSESIDVSYVMHHPPSSSISSSSPSRDHVSRQQQQQQKQQLSSSPQSAHLHTNIRSPHQQNHSPIASNSPFLLSRNSSFQLPVAERVDLPPVEPQMHEHVLGKVDDDDDDSVSMGSNMSHSRSSSVSSEISR